ALGGTFARAQASVDCEGVAMKEITMDADGVSARALQGEPGPGPAWRRKARACRAAMAALMLAAGAAGAQVPDKAYSTTGAGQGQAAGSADAPAPQPAGAPDRVVSTRDLYRN